MHVRGLLALLPCLFMAACSSLPTPVQTGAAHLVPTALSAKLGVKPWERDILARPAMGVESDPLDLAYDEHIYFSKEGTSGGRGFGGGGCGCN